MAKNVRFFLLIHRTSQSEVWSPFPYKGRLIGDAVYFEAVAYGEKRTFSGEPTCSASSKVAPTGLEMRYGEKYAIATALEPVI